MEKVLINEIKESGKYVFMDVTIPKNSYFHVIGWINTIAPYTEKKILDTSRYSLRFISQNNATVFKEMWC